MSNAFNKIMHRNEVHDLLQKLHNILNDVNFSIEDNLIVIYKSKNIIFMQKESFDASDIICVLKSLTVNNYIRSVLDDKDINGLFLHEFAIEYNNIKYIYIKFKILDDDIIIKVISFHKNEYNFCFAYSDK